MAKGVYFGVSGVARNVIEFWFGHSAAAPVNISTVPVGHSVEIGGNRFTVISHGYSKYGFSGTGTILWGETPIGQNTWSNIFTWGSAYRSNVATGVDSAYNTTITNLAISNPYTGGASPSITTAHKFRIIPDTDILNGVSAVRRDASGNAVAHWLGHATVTTEASSATGWEDQYGPWWFYYVDSSGNRQSIKTGESMESDTSTPSEYPDSTHNYYYYYACEVPGETKVTTTSTANLWTLA